MATKFFLSTNTAPYTPATIRGAWADTAGAVTRRLSSQKDGGGAITTVARAETSASNPRSVLLYRGVSGPLAAQTISGTLDLLLGVIESNASADMCYHLYAYVTIGDSDTVRGTIVSDYLEATTNEWGLVAASSGRALAAAQAISLAISDGDRLVVEIGYVARNSVTTSFTGTLYYGTQLTSDASVAPDLTAGGSAPDAAGFILLSADLAELSSGIEIRDTQEIVKSLESNSDTSKIRLSQEFPKALVSNATTSKVRVSQEFPKALVSNAATSKIRTSLIMIKVLRSTEDAAAEASGNNMAIGCWI